MRTLNEYTEAELDEAKSIVEAHNATASDSKSFYIVDVTGRKSVYFTLYRFNHMGIRNPYTYLGNLSTNIVEAVKKICTGRGNRVELSETDNFNPDFPKSGLLNFGKHKGKDLNEIYESDSGYVLWIANKFEPRTKHMRDIVQHAKHLSEMHWQMVTEINLAECTSEYVGELKERLDLGLTITFIKKHTDDWLGGNTRYKYTCKDSNGNIIQFWSGKVFEKDTELNFRGTVKAQREIVGRRTTILTRVALIN
jgi:hypothetical protein